MGTYIVLGILVIVIIIAAISGLRHFKGKGGCCGGGAGAQLGEERKALENPIIARKRITVEGMTCVNCKNRIEHRINQIEGASCQVDLSQKLALVELDREVPEGMLVNAIQGLDYKVIKVETEAV